MTEPVRHTTPISLYNTATGTIDPLETRRKNELSLYACGPTVYDHPHLGHARSAMTYDIMRRYFEWRGLDVHHVSNCTDIDDKIIDRAAREGTTEAEVAKTWEKVYDDIMDQLNVLRPHHRPHATSYVSAMVDFIQILLDNDSAYIASDGVYLRVHKVDDYGLLVHRDVDDLRDNAETRLDDCPDKEDPLDFALWKNAKPGEPTWAAPWGAGRPGWHIECVAMSLDILGDGFDLHGGGSDLVFPHHTNERAQAVAAGRDFARHWAHNAMVNIGGQKMGKSLNNYTTVADVLAEHSDNARALRLAVLQTHYRKNMELSTDVLAQARESIARIDAMARKANAAGIKETEVADGDVMERFEEAMDHDLGTPDAVATMFDTVRATNAAIDNNETGRAGSLLNTVNIMLAVFGLTINDGTNDCDDDTAAALVDARNQARADKNFTEADRLRTKLAALGIEVEDTANGTIWHRT